MEKRPKLFRVEVDKLLWGAAASRKDTPQLAFIENPIFTATLCVVVYGGFNEALYIQEHFSKTVRPVLQMRNFRGVIDDHELQDRG